MEMQKNVRSTKRPEPVEIDDFSVWVATNITEVAEEGTAEQPGFSGYEFDLARYDKDEYIRMIDEKNAALAAEVTSTQMALCEVYELLG